MTVTDPQAARQNGSSRGPVRLLVWKDGDWAGDPPRLADPETVSLQDSLQRGVEYSPTAFHRVAGRDLGGYVDEANEALRAAQ